MAKVQRTASKIAWGVKRQSAFGTAMAKTDLTKFLRVNDPILINDVATHWNDKGMIGNGHEWETQRGIQRQMVSLEIPTQAMSIDAMGYFLAMFFSTVDTTDKTSYYEHVSKFSTLAAIPTAYPFTLAILEDGNDQYIQDLAVTGLTIRGDADNRMEMGVTMVGSKIGGTLSDYTWPTAEDARYVYNYAGVATSTAAGDIKAQVRSFELTLDSGISVDMAFKKAATEANRIYPQEWNYTPARSMALSLSLFAESGDLATFRASQKAGTEDALVIQCLGLVIGATAGYDTVQITIPKAVYTAVSEGYSDGLQTIDLTVDAHYDATTVGPISILTTNDESAYMVAAS